MPPWVLNELNKLPFDFFWKGKRDLFSLGRKNVMSMRELFPPDPLAVFEKMAGFQMYIYIFLPKNKIFPLITWKEQAILSSKVASCAYNLVIT